MSFPSSMNQRKYGRSGLLARKFLERLDAGLVIDRTRACADGKSRKKIQAPAALLKYRKPIHQQEAL